VQSSIYQHQQGGGNYFANFGDSLSGTDWSTARGLFPNGDWQVYTLASVTDGTSSTLLFSEIAASDRTLGEIGDDRNIITGIALLKTGDDDEVRATIPSDCAALRKPDGTFNPVTGWDRKALRWADGRNVFCMFNTILPPNSLSCRIGSDPPHDYLMTPTSHHVGGVNTALVDGSTRFVSETIDTGTTTQRLGYPDSDPAKPELWRGPSTYGVWGAAGTSRGSESKALP
jgi:hypothetical protein